MGDPRGFLLDAVGELAAEGFAAAQEANHIPHVIRAGDDEQILDTCLHELTHGVVDHRLPPDREQMLVGHLRQGMEAGSLASRQHNAFHL